MVIFSFVVTNGYISIIYFVVKGLGTDWTKQNIADSCSDVSSYDSEYGCDADAEDSQIHLQPRASQCLPDRVHPVQGGSSTSMTIPVMNVKILQLYSASYTLTSQVLLLIHMASNNAGNICGGEPRKFTECLQ